MGSSPTVDFQKNLSDVPLLDQLFESLADKRVYYDPLRGNRGDDLILLGIDELIRKHKIRLTPDVGKADHILIKGGGALIDDYASLLRDIRRLFHETSHVPTTLLPTSYHLRSSSMSELVGPRTAPLRIYAREEVSFELLRQMDFDGPVEIGLDHDTAFHLIGSDFLRGLQANRNERHVLIVERTDAEAIAQSKIQRDGQSKGAMTATTVHRPAYSGLGKYVPSAFRSRLKHAIVLPKIEAVAMQTPVARSGLQLVHSRHPHTRQMKVRCYDVSQNQLNTFDQFTKVIADSSVVYTTRLHVGILSAMMGIPTYMLAGVYHKLSGIHAYSMSHWDHVRVLQSPEISAVD